MGPILSPTSPSSATPDWLRITYTPPDRREHLSKGEMIAKIKRLRADGLGLVDIGMAMSLSTSYVGALLREGK